MKKTTNTNEWIKRNFFLITIAIFVIIYLRWFRLTPLVLDGSYNDPNEAYITGLVFFCIYSLFAVLSRSGRYRHLLGVFLRLLTWIFLCINIFHAFYFIPRITVAAGCNEKSYGCVSFT